MKCIYHFLEPGGPRQALTLHVRGAALCSVNKFVRSCRVRRGRTVQRACPTSPRSRTQPRREMEMEVGWPVGELEGRP